MNFDFTKIMASCEQGKCLPSLTHKFETHDIIVECEYLKAGEKTDFFMANADTGSGMINFRKLFARKVYGIENLIVTVTDEVTKKAVQREISDAKTFLAFPSNTIFDEIITDVGLHLLNSDELTEAEQKN